jgi:methionyl-tRNA formyltransferase
MKIIFMGTPDFAVPVLDALKEAGQDVSLVVTQPDRAKGRGREVAETPVKRCAGKWNIPVFQPVKVKTPEAVERLRQENCDLIVVAAFGQILSKDILELPVHGCVNVHASLLPKYRGAAPIQWAVINGEKESGVTIMQMDAGLDTGDILKQEAVTLDPKETGGSLYDKLSSIGGRLLVSMLPAIEAGTAVHTVQDASLSSYAKMLQHETGEIRWGNSAVSLERLIRGVNPWPGAFFHFRGKYMKVWDADVSEDRKANGMPGTVQDVDRARIYVNTGDGVLALKEVQPEGRKRMPVQSFLLGYPVTPGENL